MACLQPTVSTPSTVTSCTLLIFLLAVEGGLCVMQTGTCRPVCSGSECVTVNRGRVDFKSAQETCRNGNGELLTLKSENANERFLEIFTQGLDGNFWIGLQLPAGSCSDLSAPLRGYEWTSGSGERLPLFNNWKDTRKVCSPHCVSVSNDQKWTERPCSDEIEGFLCRTDHKDACRAAELTESVVFKSSKGCSDGPCEHLCIPVTDGYKCTCFKGHIPDSKNPTRCKMHCGQMRCPAVCEGTSDSCYCPDGYILSEGYCEDIDECEDRGSCEEHCTNTFGGFNCSCKQGFVKDHGKCIEVVDGEHFMTTALPVITGFAKSDSKNNTTTGSAAAAGGFIWMWIFIAVALVVFICAVRYYVVKRQKHREQSSSQQTQAHVDNIEC